MQLQSAPPTPASRPVADPRITGIADLLQAKAAGNVLLHPDGRVVYFGGIGAQLLGVDPQSSVQQPFLALLPNQAQAAAAAAFQHALAGVSDPPFALHTPSASGPIGIAVQFTPITENGALLAVMANVIELASRQAVNAALRGDFESSKQLGARSVVTVFHLDGRGQCVHMGDGWTAATGRPAASALGTGWLGAIPEPDRQAFRTLAGTAHQERRGWRTEVPLLRADGQVAPADLAAAPIVTADGQIAAYIGLASFSPVTAPPAPQHAAAPQATAPVTPPAAQATAPVTPPAPQAVAPQPAPQTMAEQPAPAPETHATVAVTAEIAGQAPAGPAPKFSLPTTDSVGYSPVVQAGHTDPALLMDRIRKEEAEEHAAPVDEPAVDKVTGLANKLLFAQHVQSTVSRMQSDALTVSVSFIDLHGLDIQKAAVGKRVANDYLFLLAKRLESTIRSIEIAGRIDGNILAVLSINWLFAEDLPVVARRLMNKLGEPLSGREGGELSVAMNLGMAVASPNEDVNALFRRAWEALQRAKARGGNEFEIDYQTAAG